MAPPGGQKPFPIGVAVEGSATGADIRVTGTTTRHLGWQWGWCDRMLLHLPLTTPQVEAMTDDWFLGDVQTVRFTSLRNDGDFSASIRGDSVVFNLPACGRHNSSHRSLRVIRCCVPIHDAEGTGSPLAGDCTRSQLAEVRLDAFRAAKHGLFPLGHLNPLPPPPTPIVSSRTAPSLAGNVATLRGYRKDPSLGRTVEKCSAVNGSRSGLS